MCDQMDYLKQDDIGDVIAQGIAEMYLQKPQFPVDYLANWLLNYELQQEQKQNKLINLQQIVDLQEQKRERVESEQIIQKQEEEEEQIIKQKEQEYENRIKQHQYHNELLEHDLTNHLQYKLGLSGVYIGEIDYPSRTVDLLENDDEDGHYDREKQKVMKYVGYSEGHDYLKEVTMSQEQGVTWKLFIQNEEEQQDQEQEQDEQQNQNIEQTMEQTKEYIYIENVVDNDKIMYHQIPRLGSYMAIVMNYQTALSESAFDQGLVNRQNYLKQLEVQKTEREEKENEYQEKLRELEENGDDINELQQQWQQQLEEWDQLKEEQIQTTQKQYVLCCDTLGQDQGISKTNRQYILEMVRLFKQSWEKNEMDNLKQDIEMQIEYLNNGGNNYQEQLDNYKGEEDQAVEEHMTQLEQELNEKQTVYEQDSARWDKVVQQLQNEQIVQYIYDLSNFRVCKYQQLIQVVMILVGYKKEDINIRGTNVLDWKKVKGVINQQQFIDQVSSYSFKGSKDKEVPVYAKINRLIQRITKYNPDDVDQYNLGLGRLFRWLGLSLQLRKLDIELRREHKVKMDLEREDKIKAEEERVKEKEQQLIDYKAQLQDDEKENFNEQEWKQQYDDETPEIEIPDIIAIDIDNDIEDMNQSDQPQE